MKTLLIALLLFAAQAVYAQKLTKEAQLAKAVTENDLKLVKELVEKRAADVNAQLTINETISLPLVVKAAMDNQTEITKYLIEQGASVNRPDGFGMTCLMWAAFNGNTELVKFLLGRGADAGAETENGMTALKAAQEGGHKEIEELLTKKK